MTLRFKMTGITASNPIRYIKRSAPPVAGFGWLGFTQDNAAYSVKNCVDGGTDATWTGTASVSAAAATLTNGNYINTGVLETNSMTFMAVVQRNNAQVMFMGADVGADANGAKLYTNGSSPRKPVFDAKYTSSTAVVVSPATTWPVDPLAYECVFGIVDSATGKSILYIPRTAEWTEGTNTGSRTLSGRNIILGPGPDPATSYSGDTVLFKSAGVATAALTQGQCDTLYAWLKNRIAGI